MPPIGTSTQEEAGTDGRAAGAAGTPAAGPVGRAGPAGYDWRLAEPFMLRVAGLPFTAAADLACTRTARWADEVLAAEGLAAAARASLAGPLTDAVGRCADPAARRLLVGLRRDVHNGRPVCPGPAMDAATAVLGPSAAETLRELAATDRRLAELRAEGERRLAAELRDRRAALRRLAADPDLRLGLQLASPSLDRYADRYLAEDPPGKRARRAERSVLEYLLRAACKTSPFSTLTSVCAGTFRDDVGRAVAVRLGAGGRRSAVRLNMAVPARLSAAVLADPALRADLPVRATEGWREHGELVRYLRRSHAAHGGNGGNGEAKVDPLRETVFVVPSGPMLAELLAEVSGGPVRLGDLVERLCRRGDRDRADVEVYVGHLLRLGLLEAPCLRLDIHHSDPLARHRAGLSALDRPWARSLAGRLATVAGAVRRFAGAGVEERRSLLAEIRAEVVAAHTDLGDDEPPVPGTLVYEDTALDARDVAADRAVWERALLPDLRRLSSIMPAFDTGVLRRLVTRGYFRIRHGEGGRCEDFLTFAHEFHRDFFDNFAQRLVRHRRFPDEGGYAPHDNWFRQPELTAVDDARRAVAEHIGAAYRELAPDAEELVLDAGFIDLVSGLPPSDLGALQPRSYFLQVADDGTGAPTAVVNRVYAGLTLLFSRFAHLFTGSGGAGEAGEAGGAYGSGPAEAAAGGRGAAGAAVAAHPAAGERAGLAGRLRAVLRDVCPPGAVFAELTGGYDTTNLNLHPAVTDYEIVCPGDTSDRPAAEQIRMDDLIVCDDLRRDRLTLRSRRLDREVIPVYLGFLLPGALPEVQQVLLNFSYTGMAQLDLWAGTGVPEPDDGVVALPRIRYGAIVLARRQWSVRAARVPHREPGQGDAAWFLEWQRWRRANGLPRRVFLTARGGGEYKPLYVDFDSYLCLTLVDAVVRDDPGTLVLTEMLPGPEQLWMSRAGRSHVTELTVEIDGVRKEAP